jgi:hypothetical protein
MNGHRHAHVAVLHCGSGWSSLAGWICATRSPHAALRARQHATSCERYPASSHWVSTSCQTTLSCGLKPEKSRNPASSEHPNPLWMLQVLGDEVHAVVHCFRDLGMAPMGSPAFHHLVLQGMRWSQVDDSVAAALQRDLASKHCDDAQPWAHMFIADF